MTEIAERIEELQHEIGRIRQEILDHEHEIDILEDELMHVEQELLKLGESPEGRVIIQIQQQERMARNRQIELIKQRYGVFSPDMSIRDYWQR
jgi:2'-5' RNA ligase